SKDCIDQEYLRSYLFGNRPTGECCICGRQFPVKGLVATHIKKCSHPFSLEDYILNVFLYELTKIKGRKCFYWSKENKKYFEWHYYHHRVTT
ncbi:hypothetical protein ACUOBA_43195, partial [Escherichia coli]